MRSTPVTVENDDGTTIADPDLMFALLFWTGFVGWALNAGLLELQRRLFGPAAAVEVMP